MDELAAAAATLAMPIDDNADEDEELGSMDNTVGTVEESRAANESARVDKENDPPVPAGSDLGAANPKVSNATFVPRSAHHAPPFTRPCGPH